MNNDDLFSNRLVKFQKQFFCATKIAQLNFSELCKEIAWEDQEKLVAKTFNHPRVLSYPIKTSYQSAVLKKIIAELELHCVDVHDSLYLILSRLLNDNDCSLFFKHYTLNESPEIITLQENSNFISEGTTGLCSWQASLALSEWCIENQSLLKNKNILELGSGIGLLGITLLQTSSASKIWLTDCHPSVLTVLCKNLLLNLGENPKNFENISNIPSGTILLSKTIGNTSLEVVSLLWEEITSSASKFIQLVPDYIVAADVVYDSSIFYDLCRVFKFYFNVNPRCTVILACTVRNTETLNGFLKVLRAESICVTNLDLVPQKNFVWSTESPIEILQLTREK